MKYKEQLKIEELKNNYETFCQIVDETIFKPNYKKLFNDFKYHTDEFLNNNSMFLIELKEKQYLYKK